MSSQICVARIGAAHGVRGEVKLWTFTEEPFAVTRYGPLSTKDGARQFEVTQAREAKDHLVATLKGVTSRNEAERLNGLELYVAREKLPATEADEYYHADLIGLAAVTATNEPLGEVVAIHNVAGAEIMDRVHLAERFVGPGHRGEVVAIHNFGAGDIIEIAPPA